MRSEPLARVGLAFLLLALALFLLDPSPSTTHRPHQNTEVANDGASRTVGSF